jgi:hypothetical protein
MNVKKEARDLYNKFILLTDNSEKAKECCLISCQLAKEFITGDLEESFDKFLTIQEIETEIEKINK